jgi:hypothetical protein
MRVADRRRNDRGAFLVIFALLLVAMIIAVGIVVDLGQARSVRRKNQTVADLAALAAGKSLGNSSGPDAINACKDAWTYVQINLKGLPSGASMPCDTGFASFATLGSCKNPPTPPATTPPGSSPITINATGAGDYLISFTYPVADSSITRYGGIIPSDGKPCERMQVSVREKVPVAFGRLAGVDSLSPTMSAIVRGHSDNTQENFAALLLLERRDCAVLQTSGQANILVKKFDNDHPGIIHADSDGSGSCTGGASNQNNYVVWGGQIPNAAGTVSDRRSYPSIIAEGNGAPCPKPAGGLFDFNQGILDLVSFSSGHDVWSGQTPPNFGVCPAPATTALVSSRQPVDIRWNSSDQINTLRTNAATLAAAQPIGYRLFPDPAIPTESCSNDVGADIIDNSVYVNCAVYKPKTRTFTGANIVFSGSVQVGSGNQLLLPNAKQVVIGGCGTCTGGSPSYGLDISGNSNTLFAVNDGGAGKTAVASSTDFNTVCDNRTSPLGVTAARMTILKGPFTVGSNANLALCQTFVLMGFTSSPQQSTAGPSCSDKPCPTTVAPPNGAGYVNLSGSALTWTAPNELCTGPFDPTQDLTLCAPDSTHPFEDLALWTEAGNGTNPSGGADSVIGGGGGKMQVSGRFFIPNGTMTIGAQTSLAQPFDAQFISRRLILAGSGDLVMTPDPRNSVPNPTPAWSLIR